MKFIFIVLSVVLIGCAHSMLLPTAHDVSVAHNRWSNADSLSLHQGYKLYRNKCGACHTLYKPSRFAEEKWRTEVPKMMERAKITEEQKELILRYILTKRETMLSEKK